jgi:putative ABC transport system substrate-binding protein
MDNDVLWPCTGRRIEITIFIKRENIMKSNKYFQNIIRNRWTILTLVVVLALLLSGCRAEKPKVYRVGIIGGMEAFAPAADGFKAKMAELGYVEGENIVYDMQVATMDAAEMQRVVEQFVADEVDLILAFPTEASAVAKAATQGTDIPVVFTIAGIEGSDLVESVRQPGGNITGVRYPGPDLVVKRFEFLHELAPQIERLYIPYDPNYPNGPPALEALRPVASSHGVTLVETPVTSVEELQADLQARAASDDIGMDAIQILPEALTQSPDGWGAISSFAEEHRLPLVGSVLFSAQIGGVFSYCIDFTENGELAAPIADKVLKGTPAGTIPLVTPEAHLWINLKVIQELGLTVPEGFLAMATEIIR